MTQRRRLDAFLLDAARERGVGGARGREGRARAREHGRRSTGEQVAADVIVGADGANGITARSVGLGDGHHLRRRVRGERAVPDASRASGTRGGSCSSSPTSPAATRWVFPKGDHVERRRRRLGERGPEAEASTCGAPARRTGSIPSEPREPARPPAAAPAPGTRIAAERALLVGDAAGLIDPVSGDGMYECFVSSRLAAAAILDLLAGRASTLEPYEAAVDARARAAPPRVVEAEEGARPLAARVVADRPVEAPLDQHPRHARRRAPATRPSSAGSPGSRCGRSRSWPLTLAVPSSSPLPASCRRRCRRASAS